MVCHIVIASKSCSPATAALERALELAATSVIDMGEERPMISFKRSRSSLGPFDLSSLVEASPIVEESSSSSSIAFPSIEWSNEEDIDSEDDAEFIAPPAAKRRCRGLVRSDNIKCGLATLGISSSHKESFSSLC